ncbi:AzlD domain-containing protein [Arvimicrobium flavum]|uniref:AzlD domain-containing protein n=1 Tax=Arvimicrobium flavum TaxID=3393320 RepID=UPI00237A49E7|nr:AzlD domain-containing protein [Mesorhizobium shangrilense]
MTFAYFDAWWWPYLFIIVGGWLATDAWRFLGVYLGDRIPEKSEFMVLVRAVATAFVAAVIGNLIVFPGGELAESPLVLRVGAAASGFATFILVRRSVLAGILAAEAVLVIGLLATP